MKKYCHAKLVNLLKFAYFVGFLTEEESYLPPRERFARIRWIGADVKARKSWFADPFIYQISDKTITLLVEEMVVLEGKGVLTKIVINRDDLSIVSKVTLLELPTHLSFPNFICQEGHTYVYPENYQDGALKMYELVGDAMKYVSTLVEEPLVDSQIVEIEGAYYLFGTKNLTGKQEETRDLFVYRAESLLGRYEQIQTLFNDRCEERGAGRIYKDNQGRWIRPAQCCEGGYGRAIILYELCFDGKKFTERVIRRIEPDSTHPYGAQMHTWNGMDGLFVVDGMHIYHPWRNKLFNRIKSLC